LVVGQIVVVGGWRLWRCRQQSSRRAFMPRAALGSPNRQRALQFSELQASFANPRSMHGEPPTPCRSPPRMPQAIPENNPLKELGGDCVDFAKCHFLQHQHMSLWRGKGVPFPDVLNKSKTSFVVMVVDQPVVPRCVCARGMCFSVWVGGAEKVHRIRRLCKGGNCAKACGGHSHKGIECNMDTIEARGSVCAGSWCTNSSPTAQRTAHALTYVKWCVPK
jgi:hypothetical protein